MSQQKYSNAANEIASILAAMTDPREAHSFLLAQYAHKGWQCSDTLIRIARGCSLVAKCENKERGRRLGSERAVAGSTCITVVRDFATRVENGATCADAWSALCEQAKVGEDFAGDRPAGASSDAAEVFRAFIASR